MTTWLEAATKEQLLRELAKREHVTLAKARSVTDPRPKRPSAPKKPVEPMKGKVISIEIYRGYSFSCSLAELDTRIRSAPDFNDISEDDICLNIEYNHYYDDTEVIITAVASIEDPAYTDAMKEHLEKMKVYEEKLAEYKRKYEEWKALEKEWKVRAGL